jgi:peroxiredoxin
MKGIVLILMLLATVGCAMPVEEAAEAPAAPDFALKDISGKEHKLSGYAGKFVVLEWINHGCPFVRKHYDSGNMQKLQKTYAEKGVIWLSICSSAPGKQGNYPPETWRKLTEDKGAKPTAVLLDTDGKVGRAYGAKTTPHMFVIDPKGKLIYKGAIDDDRSTSPKKAAAAKNYVAAALDAAMAGKKIEVAETRSYGCSGKY